MKLTTSLNRSDRGDISRLEASYEQPVALAETFSPDASPSAVAPGSAVEELWTDVEGCPVRYLKCGSGPPLIMVHGMLGSAFCWRFNMQELGSVRTVYALDMPGVGCSGRIAEPECSLKTNADRLLAFMKACGLEHADFLGNSHGGAVAMAAAAYAPEKVSRLLLVAPVHPWMRQRRLFLSALATEPGSWLMRILAPQLVFMHNFFLRRMYGDPHRMAPGTLEGYSAPLRTPGTIEHLLAIVRSWKADLQDLELMLPELRTIPTLLLWGSRDKAVSPASGGMLSRFFSSCELQVMIGAGHLPYEEFPAEFNQRVLAYLKGNRGPV
jgi:pimeloyl-ACP methyl ester carboxylesterase